MKIIVRITALAALTLGCARDRAAKPSADDLVIEHVTVISPERDLPLIDRSVLIRDGRIIAIDSGTGVKATGQMIDGRGRFLIPGLIDSHVHVGGITGLDDDAIERHPELAAAHRAQVPRAFLAFGFTTVIDLNLDAGTRGWFEQGSVHPRLESCGRAVRLPGGYTALRVSADSSTPNFPNLVFDPHHAAQWPKGLPQDSFTVQRAIDRVVRDKGICVKTFVEPGFGVFDWPTFSPGTLAALRTEAARRGLPLVVHANSVGAWEVAVEAGASIIAHGIWHWPGPRTDTVPPLAARQVIARAAANGVRVQPTRRVLDLEGALFDPSILDDPRIQFSLPPAVLAYIRSPESVEARQVVVAEYRAAGKKLGVHGGIESLIAAGGARSRATTKLFDELGIGLLFGSDTPSGEGIGNPPGLNGRLEIDRWIESGISLRKILRAATLDNAAAFGLGTELGTIEVGKRADLLLLRANPLENATAYDEIDVVIVGGKPIARATLAAQ